MVGAKRRAENAACFAACGRANFRHFCQGSLSPASAARAQHRSPWTRAGSSTCLCAGEADSLPHVCARHGSVVHRAAVHIHYEGYCYASLDQTRSAEHGGVNMVASQPMYAVSRMLYRPPPVLLMRSSGCPGSNRTQQRIAARPSSFPTPRDIKPLSVHMRSNAYRVLQRLCY